MTDMDVKKIVEVQTSLSVYFMLHFILSLFIFTASIITQEKLIFWIGLVQALFMLLAYMLLNVPVTWRLRKGFQILFVIAVLPVIPLAYIIVAILRVIKRRRR